ncbi:MAG: hypothetical protein N2316_11510 [Spirochaetes bacterium]|nr:hypothetical protein [Spirochaetota bacterium]
MRRTIIVLFIIRISIPLFGNDYILQIQSEYRRDAIDFEDDTREYYRQKLKVCFSKASEANAAFVYDHNEDSLKYTWNIFLRDISPQFSFFAGNFYANFGKGMLVGKRRPFQRDVFKRQGEIFSGEPFIPSLSGNPYFAFHGCGMNASHSLGDFHLKLSAFHSIKERYINQQEYESRSTSSSVFSLDSYDEREKNRIEPISMHTTGIITQLCFLKLISFDVYGIYNSAQTPFGEAITLRYGIHSFKGIGCMAEYHDEFITIFSEIAKADTQFRSSDDVEINQQGFATISGILFRGAYLRASLIYKNAEKNFFSPYCATIGEYIGPGIFADVRYNLLSKLILGASVSSEKKSSTYTEKEIPSLHKEHIFLKYSSGLIHEMRAEFARIKRTSENEERYRYKGICSIGSNNFFLLSISGTTQQHSHSNNSYSFSAIATFFIEKSFKAHAMCARAWVGENNSLYEYFLPLKNSNIPGIFIRESGNIYALKAIFIRWGIYLSCRMVLEIPHVGNRNTIFEAFGSAQY